MHDLYGFINHPASQKYDCLCTEFFTNSLFPHSLHISKQSKISTSKNSKTNLYCWNKLFVPAINACPAFIAGTNKNYLWSVKNYVWASLINACPACLRFTAETNIIYTRTLIVLLGLKVIYDLAVRFNHKTYISFLDVYVEFNFKIFSCKSKMRWHIMEIWRYEFAVIFCFWSRCSRVEKWQIKKREIKAVMGRC